MCLLASIVSGCGLSRVRLDKHEDTNLPHSGVYSWTAASAPNLQSLALATETDLWAVGERGQVLHSTDGGDDWEENWLGGVDLQAITVVADGAVIAAGLQGSAFRSKDQGKHWEALQVGTTADLWSVFSTTKAVWIVGSNGTVLRSSDNGTSWQHLDGIKDVNLRCVAGSADDQVVFLGGEEGAVFLSNDNGGSWRKVRSGPIAESIFGLYISGNRTVLAVGDGGLIIRSDDSGVTWSVIKSGVLGGLYSISGTSDGHDIWICGQDGVLIHSNDIGSSWVRVSLPLNRGLLAIRLAKNGNVFVAGWRGTLLRGSQNGQVRLLRSSQPYKMSGLLQTSQYGLLAYGQGGTLLKSKDGAASWQRLSFDRDAELKGATESNQRVWVIGNHGTVASTTDGDHWSLIPELPDVTLNAVAGSSDGRTIFIVGAGGVVLSSSNSGATWSSSVPLSNSDLNGVCVVGTVVLAVGNDGTVMRGELSSAQWKRVNVETTDDLKAIVAAPDGRRVWVFGALGRVLYSRDTGTTWETDENDVRETLLAAVCLQQCRQVLAVGENGAVAIGENDEWKYFNKSHFSLLSVTTGSNDSVFTLGSDFKVFHPSNARGIWQNDELQDIQSGYATGNGSNIWVTGTGKICRSQDGGQNWQKNDLIPTVDLFGIVGDASGFRLWAVGDKGTVASTVNGGADWSAKEITQAKLFNIRRIADQVWIVGDKGTIFKYDSQRDEWDSVHSPINNGLLDIGGTVDGKKLWAVGFKGAIVYSDDGGRTWESQSLGSSPTLRSVAVLDDPASSILAVGDGGTIAISRNQGKRWLIKRSGSVSLQSIAVSERTKQLLVVGEGGTLIISDDNGESWNDATSGITNDLSTILSVAQGEKFYAFGSGGAFQTFNLRRERFGVGSITVDHTLNKIHAHIELPNLNQVPPPKFTVQAIRSREVGLTAPIELPAEVSPPHTGSDNWVVGFDLSSLTPHPGESFTMQTCLTQGKYSRCFPMPELTVEPWVDFSKNKYWIIPAAILISVLTILTALLFIRPLYILALYRQTIIFDLIEGASFPGSSVFKVLLRVTLLPYFAFHRRTLDAWIKKHRNSFESRWNTEEAPSEPSQHNSKAKQLESDIDTRNQKEPRIASSNRGDVYIPLPIELRMAGSNQLVPEPSASGLGCLFDQPVVVQIWGPGGIGKTTLLKQLVRWLLDPRSTLSLSRTVAVPIVLRSLSASLEENLKHTIARISGEEISLAFLQRLLRVGRIIVCVDGFSELSPDVQRDFVAELQRTSIRSLIISSRTPTTLAGLDSTELLPKPLDSRTLLYFITLLLSRLPEEQVVLNTLELQLQLGTRIVQVIKTSVGDLPLTPLLVSLFVSRAIDLLSEGLDLDGLPRSASEAYFDFIRQLIRDRVDDSESVLAAIKELAEVSLGEHFVPSKITLEQALRTLRPILADRSGQVVQSLLMSGLLVAEEIGLTKTLQFALDPVAEFCAAYSYVEKCGNDSEKWREFARKVSEADTTASGFSAATICVVESYSGRGLRIPDGVLDLFAKGQSTEGASLNPSTHLADGSLRRDVGSAVVESKADIDEDEQTVV